MGWALREEGLDALVRVLGLENLVEGAGFDLEGLVDGRVNTVVQCFNDEPRGDGRSLGDLPGQRLGVVERLAFPGQAVDEPDAVALLPGGLRAQGPVLQRPPPPDQSPAALGAALAGAD